MRLAPTLFLLLAGCSLPLWHAPPRALTRTNLFPPPAADSEIVAIAMHREGCFGTCPDYFYSFAREGHGVREGLFAVTMSRCAVGELPPGAFEALARRLLVSGFFERDSVVGQPMVDVPHLSVAARLRDGRGHEVYGALTPPELEAMRVAIDSIGALIRWDSVPPVRLGRRAPECPWPAGDATHR